MPQRPALVRCHDCRLVQISAPAKRAGHSRIVLQATLIPSGSGLEGPSLGLNPHIDRRRSPRESSIGRSLRSGWTAGERSSLMEADLLAAPYTPGSFAAVVMDRVVGHLEDPFGALRAVHSLLAPGGQLIVTLPDLRRERRSVRRTGRQPRVADPASRQSPLPAPDGIPAGPSAWFDQESVGRLLTWAGFEITGWSARIPITIHRPSESRDDGGTGEPGRAPHGLLARLTLGGVGLRRRPGCCLARRPGQIRFGGRWPVQVPYWDRRGRNRPSRATADRASVSAGDVAAAAAPR